MEKKRRRYPRSYKVRKALVTMLYRKGFSREYIAALVGWKFEEWILAYDPSLKRLIQPISFFLFRLWTTLRSLETLLKLIMVARVR